MSFRVEAPLVLAVDEGGQTHHVYAGGSINWLSEEQAEFFVAEGMVAVAGGTTAPPATSDAARPDENAPKAALIDWLVVNAEHADGSSYTESELRPHTKDQLWELIDATA